MLINMFKEEKSNITAGSVIVDGVFQLLFANWIVDIFKDVLKYDVLYWPLWLGMTLMITAVYGCKQSWAGRLFAWQLFILGLLKLITLIIY